MKAMLSGTYDAEVTHLMPTTHRGIEQISVRIINERHRTIGSGYFLMTRPHHYMLRDLVRVEVIPMTGNIRPIVPRTSQAGTLLVRPSRR
ncbi:MAG TPA: hypothetical protein VF597_01180 [Candidatus Saccharimonadales bacterium]|jgi:hypothetical protein